MKKSTYIVTATNGKTYKWTFEECEIKPEDYGNKMYIDARCGENGMLIDARYIKNYDFYKTCVDFLIGFYRENLDELIQEESEV